MLQFTEILMAEWTASGGDDSYEEFIAKKGVEWTEEMSYTGDIDMSFEEFIMTPYIDEALKGVL